MAKNLCDFGNEDLEETLNANKNESGLESNIKEAEDLFNKYKDYSENELLTEFLKTSKQKLKEGSLTMQGLENTINNLSPFLTDEQKSFLKGIIKKIDE